MTNENKLSKINLYDKFNASFVNLITPEMPGLKKIRKENGYNNNEPTFEKPFPMPLEYINLKGVKIRLAKSLISPDKPTVVLLSAFPHSILAYSPVWNILKEDFNLYAYDMPGFGGSETKAEFMTFKFQGEFLNDFLKHFKIETSHLVGPDVGMAAVLAYVGNHKHTIKSMMIGDGPAVLPSADASVMKKMVQSSFWRLSFVIAGSGALVESAKNICNVKYVPNKYEISDYKNSYKGKVANTMKWFKGYTTSLPILNASLSEIKIPTKIFWGAHDAILYKENALSLHDKLPNSSLEIFENCGHFVYQDGYLKFAKMVQDWVNQHH
ncbi:MAG: Alpha/beta hydrolase [uncultured Aureispira sp.]|uniref:Alpha/beta hydrolase n=1 Tax=uncultured Aureispira sp. TaxID=1331704 RepID=A0A6S6TMU4_9BACT|nr:MAG: Alpha/beta hydrolase [uncultured Aureispira sp.]